MLPFEHDGQYSRPPSQMTGVPGQPAWQALRERTATATSPGSIGAGSCPWLPEPSRRWVTRADSNSDGNSSSQPLSAATSGSA